MMFPGHLPERPTAQQKREHDAAFKKWATVNVTALRALLNSPPASVETQ